MFNGSDTFGGGGFMNETNMLSSPAPKREQVQRLQNVLPVVVKQINDCREDEFKLFGLGAAILCIVGVLRESDHQSAKVIYNVEDHTGKIICIWWIESESNNTPSLPSVKEGRYVRVYGSLRSHDGSKSLMVLRMFPVDDINEITNHLLQVINARVEAEHMTSETATKVKFNNPGAELANSMAFMSESNANTELGFTAIQQKVYDILKSVQTERGLNISAILTNFPIHQHKEIKNVLEFLMNEGHAYTTIDNDHYKVTESF